MKHFLALPLLLLVITLSAQSEKSATPLSPARSLTRSPAATRAVVVGISNYQDKGIPDLQYAHRDAQAFADWLKSPAGGSVPEDNIQLLTNENATNSNILVRLYALMTNCQEGDRVVIYFSGHGDVDSRTISRNGFLLAYDTNASAYLVGGVKLGDLQDIVSTLSRINKTSVLVITDACHSGKLAGSEIGGTAVTAQALAKQFAEEVKIMSCQPAEYSLEGIQWGGGRGLFSYYLLHGLTGFADNDGDGVVNLFEIQRYLEDKVSAEAGRHQFPMTVGERLTPVAHVDPPALAALVEEMKKAGTGDLKPYAMKGLEDDVLAKADSVTRSQYAEFKNALAAKNLLEPADHCAKDLFQKLSENAQVAPLQQLMRHNLAVAFLDAVQQALNALMTDDPYEVNQWREWLGKSGKYTRYPELVQRAIDLLGKEHPLYHSLEAKRLFFEAYGITHYGYGASGAQGSDSLKQVARERLHLALRYDTLAPYVYYLLGNMFLGTFQEDSLTYYYEKATALSPNWVLPHLELTWNYLDANLNFEEAGKHIHRALALRPNSYQALEMLAWWHQRYNRVDSVEAVCHQMRALRPDLPNDYLTLERTDYEITRNYDRVRAYWQKAVGVDSTLLSHVFLLHKTRRFEEALRQIAWSQAHGGGNFDWFFAVYYLDIQNWHNADSLFRRVFQDSPSKIDRAAYLAFLGKIHVQTRQLDTAEAFLQRSLSSLKTPHPSQSYSLAWLGVIAQKRGTAAEAEAYFQQAISRHPELWTFDYTFVGSEIHVLFGNFLADQNRFAEAEEKYRKSIELDPGNYIGYYAMARFRARQGKQTEALDYLEKAFDRYYPIPRPIFEEPLFDKLRTTKRFKALMTKHFPKTAKQ